MEEYTSTCNVTKIRNDNTCFDDVCKYLFRNTPVYEIKQRLFTILVLLTRYNIHI